MTSYVVHTDVTSSAGPAWLTETLPVIDAVHTVSVHARARLALVNICKVPEHNGKKYCKTELFYHDKNMKAYTTVTIIAEGNLPTSQCLPVQPASQ